MIAVIPMAGRGSRYTTKGYDVPKPLIEVVGKPMVLWALDSLINFPISKYVVVFLEEHDKMFDVEGLLRKHVKSELHCIKLREVTEGQLCTILAAERLIDTQEDVIIAASDTLVKGDLYRTAEEKTWEGLISVIDLPGEQWSFASTDENGRVVRVAEKIRISNNASTGQYYFRHGSTLVEIGKRMIASKETTRGEYYIIPVYQKMIDAGVKIGISVAREMWDMGTPEAKAQFENHFRFLS